MESALKILYVAAGGAAGAVARYLVNISPAANLFDRFPFPTFIINVLGSFLIGFLLILFTDKFPVSDNFRVAVIVGFLGAFTTFSTFETEIYSLIRERFFAMALAYLLLSVVLGFIGLIAGIRLASRL